MAEEVIFPNQVRTFRRLRGVTMQALADVLGISLSAISKIEKGYRRVDKNQLEKIAKFLCCPSDEIFLTEENAPPEVMEQWRREKERRAGINEGSGLKTLGAGLRYIRTRSTLTLSQVAEAAGMTLSVYHRIEMGQREITTDEMESLARVFGMTGAEMRRRIYDLNKAGSLSEFVNHSELKFYAGPKGGVPSESEPQLRVSERLDVKIPIVGSMAADGWVVVDRAEPDGAFSYPSQPALSRQAYAVRASMPAPVRVLPESSILIADPNKIPQTGDLALFYDRGRRAALVSIGLDRNGDLAGTNVATRASVALPEDQIQNLHKIVLVYCG